MRRDALSGLPGYHPFFVIVDASSGMKDRVGHLAEDAGVAYDPVTCFLCSLKRAITSWSDLRRPWNLAPLGRWVVVRWKKEDPRCRVAAL